MLSVERLLSLIAENFSICCEKRIFYQLIIKGISILFLIFQCFSWIFHFITENFNISMFPKISGVLEVEKRESSIYALY